VRREVKLPGAGTFVLQDVPEPVHGTFFIQSEAALEAQVSERIVQKPLKKADNLSLLDAVEGRTATFFFSDARIAPVTGKLERAGERARRYSTSYEQPAYNYGWHRLDSPPQPTPELAVLQTDTGTMLLNPSLIQYAKLEGKEEVFVKQRAPVLLLKAGPDVNKPTTALITYLSKGMAWAPSYRVDISDPKTLAIEQSAVVRNELEDLDGVEVELISGFPSIQFAHVLSPLSPKTTWAQFFTQLNQRIGSGSELAANMRQQVVAANDPGPLGLDLGARPAGEGVDLHYQPIGPRSLKEGDALLVSTGSEKAAYERIIEWIIPDLRNEFGQPVDEWRRQQDPEKYQDAAWDAVRFRNPFKFPMTTGAATIVANGRFNGQRTSFWVNCGEETSLHITKALSVRTRSTEREEEGKREDFPIGSHHYWKTVVAGELRINNHRNEDVKVVIRRQFSGELISADGEPKKMLREEGVYSVNPRQQLYWTVTLKAGEEKTLNYRYSVLVLR
jgi:hypothetical protein